MRKTAGLHLWICKGVSIMGKLLEKLKNSKRLKNPWFLVGLVGVVLTATGMDPAMFTSWGALGEAAMGVLKNPFLLGTAALAVLGVFVEPTTKGITDGKKEG